MSKLTEIQNQYQGYVAACEAVAKTNPGDVEVVYKGHDDPFDTRDDGIFIYHPDKNQIVIHPRRCMYNEFVHINADDVPALIKALREFFE
jgi:ABC-type tungstate transport system permease subunit